MRTLVLAAAAAALLAGPLSAGAALAAPKATTTTSTTTAKGPSKMSACAAKWSAMGAPDKDKYNTKAKGMKSKKGNNLSGYNVWTGECMKAKA